MWHQDFKYSNTTISLSNIKFVFEFNISGYKTSTLINLKHFCVLQKYLLKYHTLFLALLYFQWRIMSLTAWNQVMGIMEYRLLADDFISCHITVKHSSITWIFQLQLWLWKISSGITDYNTLFTDCQIECILSTNDYFVGLKEKITKYITERFEKWQIYLSNYFKKHPLLPVGQDTG